jgi:hypothetical protein
LDELRFEALGEKRLQLVLTASTLLITQQLVGGDIATSLEQFKQTLKNELIVILNDVDWGYGYLESCSNRQ